MHVYSFVRNLSPHEAGKVRSTNSNHDAISIFNEVPPGDQHSRARHFRCQTELLRVRFPSCNFFTKMNEMNEKIKESHECKRQLRLQRQREKLARLDCDTKDQCERTLQLRRDRKKNRRAGDTRQEKEQLRLQR